MTDKIIYKGMANHFRDSLFGVDGGFLTLFENKLAFTPHRFNFSRVAVCIPLDKIKNVEIKSFITLGPNLIITESEKQDAYRVYNSEIWKQKIEEQLAELRVNNRKNNNETKTINEREEKGSKRHRRIIEDDNVDNIFIEKPEEKIHQQKKHKRRLEF